MRSRPDAAVAVEERVDRLELRVGERGLDERRQRVVVEELLPRRRGSPSARRAAAARSVASASVHPAGPIQFWLRRNSPGRGRVAAHAAHELLVQLAHEAQRERQRAQPLRRRARARRRSWRPRADRPGCARRPPRPRRRGARRASPGCPRCGSRAPPHAGGTGGSGGADSGAAAPRRRAGPSPGRRPRAPPPARSSHAMRRRQRRRHVGPVAPGGATRRPCGSRRASASWAPYLRPRK